MARPRADEYLPAAGVLLDVLDATGASAREAAAALGTTTANLIDFLQADPRVWQAANALRTRHGRSPLHT